MMPPLEVIIIATRLNLILLAKLKKMKDCCSNVLWLLLLVLLFWNVAKDSSSVVIEDIVTLVKGGITHSSSGLIAIRNPDTYKNWGATLKYNPALIEYEVTSLHMKMLSLSGTHGDRTLLLWLVLMWSPAVFFLPLPRPCQSMSWCASAQPPTT